MAKYKKWISNEGLSMIEEWAKNGLTDAEIAHNMGVCPFTLYAFEKKHPEILNAINRGKEVANCKVENALFDRAIGCNGNESDVVAQIFWLKNRRPDKWR